MRSIGAAVVPATFGIAGVIYTDAQTPASARDETWLTRAFPRTPWTVRRQWRAENVTIVTAQHAHEVKAAPGSADCSLPRTGSGSGLVFGHFFAVDGSEAQIRRLTEQALGGFTNGGARDFGALNGAWCSVLWDSSTRQAHFARDRLGAQVLYVAPLPGRILFTSDLRVFHDSGLLDAMDEQAMAEFLHYLYVPAPRTLSEGCHAVLPAHVLTVSAGVVRQERYIGSRFVAGPRLPPAEVDGEIERQLPAFEDKLLAAVADCVPPTGRVVLTLSGGKDSATLAVALSKICPERVLAVTVGERAGRLSEADDAALVCRALGLKHECYIPSDAELAAGIDQFAAIQDQPLGDPVALPYFLAMARLPEDCTVIVDGTGNDYYFGISSGARGVLHRRRMLMRKYVPEVLWPLFIAAMKVGPRGFRNLAQAWSKPAEESFIPWEGWNTGELRRLLRREISFADTQLWQVMRAQPPFLQTEVVCGVWSPHTSYRKAVYLAHALGRGIRLPFIDDRLASFVNGLPEQLKSRDGVNKQIIRAYMRRNLPREIVEKPKSGFMFDLNRLFQNPACRWVDELNDAERLRIVPQWDKTAVSELLSAYRQAPHDARWQQRLYVLCLAATVLAVRDGYRTGVKAPS